MTKILIVDDDLIIRDLFERILSREGYEVISADTGENCLAVVAKEGVENIGLIFLDLKMPGIGGEITLDTLKRCYENLPIVIISAYGDFFTRVKVLEKKAAEYIPKPFDSEYIKTVVRNRAI